MSAENRNFSSMNTEIQLQLANIRIAQLLDELSELRKHSGASHEAELLVWKSGINRNLKH